MKHFSFRLAVVNVCPVLVPSELLSSTHLPTSEGWTAELTVGLWLVVPTTGFEPTLVDLAYGSKHCALTTRPHHHNTIESNRRLARTGSWARSLSYGSGFHEAVSSCLLSNSAFVLNREGSEPSCVTRRGHKGSFTTSLGTSPLL